jgi:predicted alpha/beta-hydrolase family hydrolase
MRRNPWHAASPASFAPRHLDLAMSSISKSLLRQGPPDASIRFVLAHGAGAGMRAPFMDAIASGLVAQRLGVVRFEFPYMRERSAGGARRAPDRTSVLRETWVEVVHALGDPRTLVIGGKSMGGRIASMVADETGVQGLVCLGYPFHPPGKPQALRTAHLAALKTRTLIIQGTRDTMGTREEVARYTLSPAIELLWIEDGDHSLRPRRRSGMSEAQALERTVAAMLAFARGP